MEQTTSPLSYTGEQIRPPYPVNRPNSSLRCRVHTSLPEQGFNLRDRPLVSASCVLQLFFSVDDLTTQSQDFLCNALGTGEANSQLIEGLRRGFCHEVICRGTDKFLHLMGKFIQVAAHCANAGHAKILDIPDLCLELSHELESSRYLFRTQSGVE